MARASAVVVVVLAACGSEVTTRPAPVWVAATDVSQIAANECREMTDVIMRQHGFPTYPAAWTPHQRYRRTVFADCMTKKGYALAGSP